jgi:acetyl esterase/lipase
MNPFFYTAWILVVCLFSSSCSLNRVSRSMDITYMEEGFLGELPEKQLNVFAPRNQKYTYPVMLFIHGGSWRSGKKELYMRLGNRFARRKVVMVIMDYPLAPGYKVHAMAKASAKGVQWVQENIASYGGDPEQIYVSGHSAGGHLSALITVRDEYFDSLGMDNPIAGAILIDPAGLDMYSYLVEANNAPGTSHRRAFTDDPQVWKDTSPMYHLHEGMPPMMIMVGGRTEPSIPVGVERFREAYQPFDPQPLYYFQKRKKHIPMIVQFLYTPSRAYPWVLDFLNQKEGVQQKIE